MNRPHEFHANRNLFSTNSNPKIGIQLLYQVDDGLWKANVVRFRNAQISDHIAIAFLFAVFVVERDSVFEVVSIYSQVFRLYNGNVGHVINWFRSQIAQTPSTTKAEHLQCWKHSVQGMCQTRNTEGILEIRSRQIIANATQHPKQRECATPIRRQIRQLMMVSAKCHVKHGVASLWIGCRRSLYIYSLR